MKNLITAVFIILSTQIFFSQNKLFGQEKTFTKKDSLFGSNTKFRDFWDVQKYDVEVEPNFDKKFIKGSNRITFTITKDVTNPTLQIDLQDPMKIDNVISDFEIVSRKKDGNFTFIQTKGNFKKGENYFISIDYSGNPHIAAHAPWDGGWVFTKDEKGNPWMSAATEEIGESIWLPCKDIWSDEPDLGITFKIITPKNLVGVGNGKLASKTVENNKNVFTWEVTNPIGLYSIIPYIGKYTNFKDTYQGEKGELSLDYWVLDYNLDKAKKQFEQVKPMLKSFEYWFGPYPFYEDSYKLVESPYLGMEHQSNVAYGNHYQNGYLGRDLSDTGAGLGWDYIIIHESGHEWFANNITAKDIADMWIHEGFTDYSETLYIESTAGKQEAEKYIIGLRKNIQNDKPIIGVYGVSNEGSSDMYYKGANMIHTIRQVINDDEKFRQILRGLNKDFYHQTVTTQQVEKYISDKAGIDLSSVFNQYLRTTKIPILEYKQDGKKFSYRWTNVVDNFNLPLHLKTPNIEVKPTTEWQTTKLKSKEPVSFNDNYYIEYKKGN